MSYIGTLMTSTKIYIFNYPFMRIVLLGIFVLSCNSAQAEIEWTGWYSGLYYSSSRDEFEPDVGVSNNETRGHLKIKLGKYLNKYISLEGQLGGTTNSDVNSGISTHGAYFRVNQSFGKYTLYGLLGLGGIYSYDDELENISEFGGSYGIGLEIFGSKDLSVTFEYLTILDKSVNGDNPTFGSGDLKFDTIGIGFTYYFNDEKSAFIKNRNKIRSIRY